MGQIYELKLKTVIQGQSALNRFHFYATQTGNSEELGLAWLERIFPHIKNIMCEATSLVEVEVNCLTLNIIPPYIATLLSTDGDLAGDELPAYNATGFQLIPASNVFRKGSKRFPSIPENQNDNGQAEPIYQNLLDILAVALSQVIVEASSDYLPGLARTDDSGATWLFSQLIAAAYKRFTTQNTRKTTSGGGEIELLVPTDKQTWDIPMGQWVASPLTTGTVVPYDNWVAQPGNVPVSGFVTTTNFAPPDLT